MSFRACCRITWGRLPTCQEYGRSATCPTILQQAVSLVDRFVAQGTDRTAIDKSTRAAMRIAPKTLSFYFDLTNCRGDRTRLGEWGETSCDREPAYKSDSAWRNTTANLARKWQTWSRPAA